MAPAPNPRPMINGDPEVSASGDKQAVRVVKRNRQHKEARGELVEGLVDLRIPIGETGFQ